MWITVVARLWLYSWVMLIISRRVPIVVRRIHRVLAPIVTPRRRKRGRRIMSPIPWIVRPVVVVPIGVIRVVVGVRRHTVLVTSSRMGMWTVQRRRVAPSPTVGVVVAIAWSIPIATVSWVIRIMGIVVSHSTVRSGAVTVAVRVCFTLTES